LIVPEAFAIIRFASGFQDNPINIWMNDRWRESTSPSVIARRNVPSARAEWKTFSYFACFLLTQVLLSEKNAFSWLDRRPGFSLQTIEDHSLYSGQQIGNNRVWVFSRNTGRVFVCILLSLKISRKLNSKGTGDAQSMGWRCEMNRNSTMKGRKILICLKASNLFKCVQNQIRTILAEAQ
jgi:hypothetical protein